MKGAWILLVALTLGACRSSAPLTAYTPPAEVDRNPVEAERLSRQAADAIEAGNLATAENTLRRALAHDLYCGPAHNNLGVVYLKQDKLYEAANEFEWARKLMPGHPDPRVNLALCLERAGKIDDAFRSYEAALEVSPGYLPAIQGAAVLAVRSGREDERLAGWLDEIALRCDDTSWRTWGSSQRHAIAR